MIHPIPPGLFCVPSTLVALTGRDPVSVIVPAINRHSHYRRGLHDTPAGVSIPVLTAVLEELGYRVRRYKTEAVAGQVRAHVATWAQRSRERWPGRAIILCTSDHCLTLCDGIVYDNWEPRGVPGREHPYARTVVTWAALVELGNS